MKMIVLRKRGWLITVIIFSYLFSFHLAFSQSVAPLRPSAFTLIAPQGFSDRQNSFAWSMVWWKGKLYVGTGRSTQCVLQATSALFFPILTPYPPKEPDIECTRVPQDLSLQAEIWRWTPESDNWERVFQSPNDVPIPDSPGKTTARDIGFRSMLVFTEPDGTEALYVGGISSNSFNAGVPGPRILRSTDGLHFTPLPQDPGTFLGNLTATGFRSLTAYKDKLYVIASSGFSGFGSVLESADPAKGNDSFKLALPNAVVAFELEPYNGFLYVGTSAEKIDDLNAPPYTLLKTNATGAPPYTATLVIPEGGYRKRLSSRTIVSMKVFKDRLYVGTDRPAELIRVNPDDTWDLVVGTPRWTPIGFKYPLSGMDVGFDNPFNLHIWRMHVHEGRLYVGTMDQSTRWRIIPGLRTLLAPEMGFDLFSTANGRDFTMITRTGFDDIFDVGVRNFASTSVGLVVGSANHYFGTKIRLATDPEDRNLVDLAVEPYQLYLPLISSITVDNNRQAQLSNALASANMTSLFIPSSHHLPKYLAVEEKDGQAILAWEFPFDAPRFRIFRAESTSNQLLNIPGFDFETSILGAYQDIGVTDRTFFIDTTVAQDKVYHYYVQAEDLLNTSLGRSNLVRYPSLLPEVTFQDIQDLFTQQFSVNVSSFQDTFTPQLALNVIREQVEANNLNEALIQLVQLQRVLETNSATLAQWQLEVLGDELSRLKQRMELVQLGVLAPADLFYTQRITQ